MSNEVSTIKISSLVSAITTVATCSESEDVNLEALLTLRQVLSPQERGFGPRPIRRSYNRLAEEPEMSVRGPVVIEGEPKDGDDD